MAWWLSKLILLLQIAFIDPFGTKNNSTMQINTQFSSPNYSTRTKEIEYIILHYTEMPFQQALERLCDPSSKVSSHYLIHENGEIFQLVDPSNIAWHAGVSSWHGVEKLNENSIGIEIDNLGVGEFSKQQISGLIELCKVLMAQYNIPKYNIIGHSDVAPDRKIDPGLFFEWKYLAEHNIGIWHNLEIPEEYRVISSFGDESNEIKNLQLNLRTLGYKIETTGNFDRQTNFVVRAFQSKFYPLIIQSKGIKYYFDEDSIYEWDEFSQRILETLV